MADEGSITLSKDHIYGIVVVALVALLTISVFTSGFGIVPVKSGNTGGTCGTGGTETGSNNTGGSVGTGTTSGLSSITVGVGENQVRGQSSATVTWVEFSDYQCPYCAKLYNDVDTQVKANYVDSGKVKMYFRDWPLSFHQNAQEAAMGAICAGAQGKYWEMHDKLFTTQSTWSSSSDFTSVLGTYASGLGLDATEFASCLSASTYSSQIAQDQSDGSSLGVQGTPAVFLLMPKSKTNLASLQSIVSSQSLQLYEDSSNYVVLVPGAYPYATFAAVLNTVTY